MVETISKILHLIGFFCSATNDCASLCTLSRTYLRAKNMSRMGRVKQLFTFGSQRREACLDRKASGSAYKLWTWFIQTSSNVYREDQAMQMQLEDSLWRYYQQVQITAWIVLYCNYIFLILQVDHQPSRYERSETIQTKYLRLDGQVWYISILYVRVLVYFTVRTCRGCRNHAESIYWPWDDKRKFRFYCTEAREIYTYIVGNHISNDQWLCISTPNPVYICIYRNGQGVRQPCIIPYSVHTDYYIHTSTLLVPAWHTPSEFLTTAGELSSAVGPCQFGLGFSSITITIISI